MIEMYNDLDVSRTLVNDRNWVISAEEWTALSITTLSVTSLFHTCLNEEQKKTLVDEMTL